MWIASDYYSILYEYVIVNTMLLGVAESHLTFTFFEYIASQGMLRRELSLA